MNARYILLTLALVSACEELDAAGAGADFDARPCNTFVLSGSGANVAWTVRESPAGATILITDDSDPQSPVYVDLEGQYVFTLTSEGATDEVAVDVRFAVTTLDDISDDDDGVFSLRETVLEAQACAGPNTLTVDVSGGLVLDSPIQVNSGDALTLIGFDLADVSSLTSDGRLFELVGVDFRFERFRFHDVNFSDNTGGSLFQLDGASLTLSNSEVTGNRSDDILQGGQIYGENQSDVRLVDVRASGNFSDLPGGVVFLDEGNIEVEGGVFRDNIGASLSVFSGTITLNGTTFSDNIASRGAAANVTNGDLVVTGCDFTDNEAEHGGALYLGNQSTFTGSTLDLTQSTFSRNTATTAGGAVSIDDDTIAWVEGSTFSENGVTESTASGGAVSSGGALEVSSSTFIGNSAPGISDDGLFAGGGAIAVSSLTNTHSLEVTDCTFEANSAEEGGAITADGILVRVTDSTFSANTAVEGGALALSSADHIEVMGCTLDNNLASNNGGGIWFSGTTRDLSNNTSNLLLIDTTITSSVAQKFGGGVYSLIGDVILSGSTSITANTALVDTSLGKGGGVCNNGGWVIGESRATGNDSDDFCNSTETE